VSNRHSSGLIWTGYWVIFVQTFQVKQVTIVVPNGNPHMSSIAGSFEILTRAESYWKKKGNRPTMDIHVAGFIADSKAETGFFSVDPKDIRKIKKTDLLIIPSLGNDYENAIKKNKELINWISSQFKTGAEIASICTGAFLLAATGLLTGKTCSTHWNAAADFRRLFPNIQLHADKLLTVEKGIYTNGGAYSFLNLILFLIEKYYDRDTAIYCSKVFQIDIERNSQSPFSIFQTQKNHGDDLISRAQNYIEENLSEKISFEQVASKLAISRRNFDRRFIKAIGNTPVAYLQRVKVEVAKRILEKGRKSIFEVMYEVGYSDDKAFREVFKKITGLSPLDYRAKYNKEPVSG
jgi:transcriptional regulator GlxA family with amidase domain